MNHLSGLSNSEIEQAIKKMQKGIEIKPNSPEAMELQIAIDRALDELQRRANQKKSEELQPNRSINIDECLTEVAKTEKENFELAAKKAGLMGTDKPSELFQKSLERIEGVKTIENRVVVGRASENVVTIPVAEVKVGGQYRQLTQTEIVGWLKTYFKRVACRMAEDGKYTEAYASKMGQDVWRLFDGWNLIYRETNEGTAYPPMTDIFPGWKNASQAQKVAADVLWRWAANDK